MTLPPPSGFPVSSPVGDRFKVPASGRISKRTWPDRVFYILPPPVSARCPSSLPRGSPLLKERIPDSFRPDSGFRAVPGQDSNVVLQFQNPPQGGSHRLGIRGWEINPPDRAGKKRVPCQQRPTGGVQESDRSRAVSRQMKNRPTRPQRAWIPTLKRRIGRSGGGWHPQKGR